MRFLISAFALLLAAAPAALVAAPWADSLPQAAPRLAADSLAAARPDSLPAAADSLPHAPRPQAAGASAGPDIDALQSLFQDLTAENDALAALSLALADTLAQARAELDAERRRAGTLALELDTLRRRAARLAQHKDSIRASFAQADDDIAELRARIAEQSALLDQQNTLVAEKDRIIREKEEIYRAALSDSRVDQAKLQGLISAKDQEVQGKAREIELLSRSIGEKQLDLDRRQSQMDRIEARERAALRAADSLRDTLHSLHNAYLRLSGERDVLRSENRAMNAKITQKDKRDKQVAIVQGVALRFYRSPDYTLSPVSAESTLKYEITNRNAGGVEFDLLTGAAVRIARLSPEGSKYNCDLGWFVAFGGENLFKNFYVGPDLKMVDFAHLSVGLNFGEFLVLKDGFGVGSQLPAGMSIPTVRKWKCNFYFSLSFDFELLTLVTGKM